MKTWIRQRLAGCARIGIIVILTGCATVNPQPSATDLNIIDTQAVIAQLTPDIEALYLSWHELQGIYKDIKSLERGMLLHPNDRQLGHIQKTALYVQDASVRIHHIWEQLSIVHYIRPDRMRDYLAVTVNTLTATIKEMGYDDRFIAIYATFIDHAAIRGDVKRARKQLADIEERLKEIRDQVEPMIRQKNSKAKPSWLHHNTRPLRLMLWRPSVKGIRRSTTSPLST